ncbi:MAG: XRE family transcriptional regulator [Fusobacteriaceae bacterium]|nr:XRE family transcriptional regulator [Fusobacteriaceae bacterium]
MLKKELLLSFMALHNDNSKSLAEYLNITPTRFSQKLNETKNAYFTKEEMERIKAKYKLSNKAFMQIFFAL